MVDYRLRRNLWRINRGLKRFQYQTGQSVTWYPFDSASLDDDGTDTDLYDEGIAINWLPGLHLPVLQAYYIPATQNDTGDGLYLVDSLRLTIGVDQFQKFTHLSELDRSHRLNDRVSYEGRVYSVNDWRPKGRAADKYTIITATCVEVREDEGVFDTSGEPGVG